MSDPNSPAPIKTLIALGVFLLAACSGDESANDGETTPVPISEMAYGPAPIFTRIEQLGDSDTFGEVTDATLMGDLRIVADGLDGVLYLFRGSSLLDSLGRKGSGPGEFLALSGLAWDGATTVAVADRGSARLTFVSIAGDSLSLGVSHQLSFTIGDVCYGGGRWFVLGTFAGGLLHHVSQDSGIVASYPVRTETDQLKETVTSAGKLICRADVPQVAVLPITLGEVWIVDATGSTVGEARLIPGYSGVIYEGDATGVVPKTPPSGYVHMAAGGVWLTPTRLLIQLDRSPPSSNTLFDTRQLDTATGWDSLATDIPRVLDLKGDNAIIVPTRMQPHPEVSHVRWN